MYRPENRAISVNTKQEFISELIQRFGFSCTEQNTAIILRVPSYLGTGYIKIEKVSDDITIGTIDIILNIPLVAYYDSYANTCEVTYCLSGHVAYSETGLPKAELGKNEIGIYAMPRSRGMMMLLSGERIFLVSIESNGKFHQQLPHVAQCSQFDDPAVQALVYSMAKPVKATAKIHNRFRSILENNMTGSLLQSYLEATSKMLLAEIWQENIVERLSAISRINRTDLDMQALMNARNILCQRYMEPPTIYKLARMVAMNEYTLKQGFRLAFGKSIHEFARSVRMEHARDLLEDRSMSIGQVAAMVGYANASHFARAFRNEFGINPKKFRIGS